MDGLRVDDLWTPDAGTLPQGPTLRAITRRLGALWEAPDLDERVKIGYSPRLRTTLGRALLDQGRVELNPRLLLDHPAELIPTLAHELAHLLVYWRCGRVAPHGIEFRTLMAAANLPADATHNLPVGHLRRKRSRYLYLHKCTTCGGFFVARRCYRRYHCATCGPDSSFEIFRTPDTPEGREMLKHAGGG